MRREPPGQNRTFYSLQPDGLRRAATNVDGIARGTATASFVALPDLPPVISGQKRQNLTFIVPEESPQFSVLIYDLCFQSRRFYCH